ncbi:hypothetical protein IGI39_001456 [Enterococcus sp. AZ135]|uniref:class I SAM-dependent methyltransferase n=1 Tax=unclassified Enterococcus TaxID=2608891 RepID=UPI003F23EDA3
MNQKKKLNWTFDTTPLVYDKIRPGYVNDLYSTIFEYNPVNKSSKVIEIGIGSGQATLPFLRTGCTLTAVEYGTNFSKLLRTKFKDYSTFSVITNKFENVEFENNTFDLAYSATAFHWIQEEIGYPKVYSLLKSGGTFAQFANHPRIDKDDSILTKEIDELYSEYYYRYHKIKEESLRTISNSEAQKKALIAEKYGFTDVHYKLFNRTRNFSAKEYLTLLSTYSDHIAIEKKFRAEFFSKIENAINRCGGKITVHDIIDLQLARKP